VNQAFLEQQTDAIVGSIQSLLNAMRQPGPYDNTFLDIVKEITTVVESVVKESKAALSGTDVSNSAGVILGDLTSVSGQLSNFGREMVESAPTKNLKQKMASSSYEIAKFVKELLNLLE
jgi:hypothetical protein